MAYLRGATRAIFFAGLVLGAAFGVAEGDAQAQRSRPLTKKERAKRQKEQEDAAKKDQEKKDQDAAAAAEEEEKKKKAAATSTTPAPAAAPKTEWDDSVEADKAIFISADLGFTRADLTTLAASSMAFDRGSANGVLLGLTAGLRLKDWQYGLRYRDYDTTQFTLWSFSASVAYAFKYRPVTPIVEAHLGYVFSQSIESSVFKSSLPEGTVLPPQVDVKGLMIGGEGSANYWLTKWFRLGGFLGFDIDFLSRARAPLPQSVFGPDPAVEAMPLYHNSGFGIGLNINLGLRGSFDIGIE